MKTYLICPVSELRPGTKKVIKLGGYQILVINLNGEYFAMDNVCPHAKGDLSQGRIEDDRTITCLNHGTCFDLKTGAVRIDKLDEDLLDTIDPDNLPFRPLPVFTVHIENGMVVIDIDD